MRSKAFVVLVAALAGCKDPVGPLPPPTEVVVVEMQAPADGAEHLEPAFADVRCSARSTSDKVIVRIDILVNGQKAADGPEAKVALPVGTSKVGCEAVSETGVRGRKEAGQRVYPQVRGVLVSPFNGFEQYLGGMPVVVRGGNFRDSAKAAADGKFAVSSWATKSGSFEFSIAGGQKFFGLEGTVSSADAGSVNAFMTPRCVPLNSGEFAGQCVGIDVLACFRVAADGYSYCPVNWWDKTKPAIRGWADLPELPLKVVFDHQKTHRPFPAEDSVTFWEIIRENESRLDGIRFVESSYTGRVAGTIYVMKDSTTNFSFASIEVDSRGLLQKCTLQMGARTSGNGWDPFAVSHELVHCLGIDHLANASGQCFWLSVMSRAVECTQVRLTAHDAAYIKLVNAEAKARRDKNTRFGLGEAWAAEKRRAGS